MSLAIGLDVSELRMGWAVVDYDTLEPLALGVEDLRERDGGWAEDQVLRAMHQVQRNIAPVPVARGDVFVVGIEDAYLGPNKKASLRHASVVGMATMAARVVFGPSVTYWPIPADSWRHALGIKGRNRKEKKALTLEWAAAHVVSSNSPLSMTLNGITEDEADALGIATACAMLTEKSEAA
jgi:Holliday junction resolvasome RuvABC endonuclease subunit